MKTEPNTDNGSVRLNKYLALCGVASRRGAGHIIKSGRIKVDGAVVTDIGYRLLPAQTVTFNGKEIRPEERKVYLLMNKPKDYITTVKDERGRNTVLDLVGKRIKERIYPVGRLDRMTTGLLLLTNDGDLARKLSHPSFEVKKIYHVEVHKPVPQEDADQLMQGITLDDGPANADKVTILQNTSDRELGIELHSGRNRVIRRMFQHLGYQVIKLDRVYYAGLTKKDLPRGRFRHLTEKEIILLKHFT